MIGRKKEIEELNRLYEGNRSELVAVYGRRRVGKTFLIDHTFEGKFKFRHAGLSPVENNGHGMLQKQLNAFYRSLVLYGMPSCEEPKDWMEAFFLLETYLQKIDDGSRQLIFLDELPWMDTPRSGFITAFEGFWNNWGCHRDNLMVIVCGSANSWILDKLVNNHGGLYDRVTYEIKLSPFTLHECEEFFEERQMKFSRYDIAQCYMAYGGIPYYLGYMDGSLSFAQNIDHLFFARNAKLKDEYDRLFSSLFVSPDAVKEIVCLLSTRKMGFTRKEIARKLKVADGGTLTKNLKALIAGDFIVKYVPFDVPRKQEYYKLIDPYCLFYLRFLSESREESFWTDNLNMQEIVVWRGLAFENLCFNHINQIKKALGISGVATVHYAWAVKDEDQGTQIDLLISRQDNVVNMCEMKFYSDDFSVKKSYYRTMLGRQEMLSEKVSRKKAVRSTLVTTFGLKKNEYSGVYTNVITLDDLFAC